MKIKNLFKKTKTPIEQGRSMVEMLGVLAIIGVLSIGGIAGYNMAMNRYKANEILDMASKLSVMAQTGAAADSENWDGVTNEMCQEIGVDYYRGSGGFTSGGIDQYEVTFGISGAGDVDVYSRKSGIQNALKSITGSDNPGIWVD